MGDPDRCPCCGCPLIEVDGRLEPEDLESATECDWCYSLVEDEVNA